MPEPRSNSEHRNAAGFSATRWSVVMAAARGKASAQAADALAELCRTYWYPLYAYVRRRGYDVHQAEDLTQEFFARLLAKDFLASVAREKGKFRSFLLASLRHFLANEWDRARAQKRGGGRAVIPLDALTAESRYRVEPADTLTPEKLFERQWALTVLEQVLGRLQAEFVARGKLRLFQALERFLTGDESPSSYAQVGLELGMRAGAVKVAVHRLRRRYRELLREEISQTVENAEEIDEEIRYLLSCQ